MLQQLWRERIKQHHCCQIQYSWRARLLVEKP